MRPFFFIHRGESLFVPFLFILIYIIIFHVNSLFSYVRMRILFFLLFCYLITFLFSYI